MRLRIASWNINSVRLRAPQVQRFIADHAPDVLCLQEIKCREGEFPTVAAFVEAGLPHLRISGQKGWHGVAIASRLPTEDAPVLDVCREKACPQRLGHRRRRRDPQLLHPGRRRRRRSDVEPEVRPQTRLLRAPDDRDGEARSGPAPGDLWRPQRGARRVRRVEPSAYMSKIVSHTPIEVEAMAKLKASAGFIDLLREATPEPEKLASWWSYRAADFRKSNRGLRLDHIWITPGLREAAYRLGSVAARVHDDVRELGAAQRPCADHGRSRAVIARFRRQSP